MKKKQINLKNTVRKTFAEGYSYRPANNKNLYKFTLSKDEALTDSRPVLEKIRCLSNRIDASHSIYMLRLVYKYIHRKSGKCVKVKRTPFYFIDGDIKPKKEVVDYFKNLNETVSDKIAAMPGENVFWIHYEVQPLSPKHNYELIEGKVE